MARRDAGVDDLAGLRTVADYQFGAGAGTALFPPDEDHRIRRSNSGRPRQVVRADDPAVRVVSYGTDGRFSLGVEGGRRLLAAFDPPRARVAVGEESREFVRDGRNAFAKFVRDVDPAVRPGDDVLVVDDRDELLGVGRAELPADWMADFDSGMAVKVRHGNPG
ncbi:pseudouridine synthase [Halobacteriales archaeon QS_8_69_26]|nr:MAG: pseudouridine synthase [Halobacteriales archaeon QS_8_69_26]